MAAPLGFKTFTTGEVLTAADTNGYLMQGVLVFADAAARTAAITSPQEGQTSYLKDTDVVQVYSGSAWVTKSGAPSPLTTKGDLYTYSTTDARLAVGANDTVLTADSTAATGMKWAAPSASGGMTLLSTTTLSSTSVTLSSISQSYKSLYIVIRNFLPVTDASNMLLRFNGDSGTRYAGGNNVAGTNASFGSTYFTIAFDQDNVATTSLIAMTIPDYTNTTTWKMAFVDNLTVSSATPANYNYRRTWVAFNQTGAISSIGLGCENPGVGGYASGSYTSGTVYLYGVN